MIDKPDATIQQKEQLIATVSILSSIASVFSYFKAGDDSAAALTGLLVGGLNSSFKKLEEILWNLF